MKLYCDWQQARIGSVGLVLKVVEYDLIHSVFQNGARLATAGFRSVSLRQVMLSHRDRHGLQQERRSSLLAAL
jgi:hypothetical protein